MLEILRPSFKSSVIFTRVVPMLAPSLLKSSVVRAMTVEVPCVPANAFVSLQKAYDMYVNGAHTFNTDASTVSGHCDTTVAMVVVVVVLFGFVLVVVALAVVVVIEVSCVLVPNGNKTLEILEPSVYLILTSTRVVPTTAFISLKSSFVEGD